MVFALGFPTLLTWVYFVALHGAAEWSQRAAYLVGKIVQFAFPVVWVVWIERQRRGWRAPGANGIAEGVSTGLLAAAGIVCGYFLLLKNTAQFSVAASAMRDKVAGIGLLSPAAFWGLAVFYALFHSLLEEYYWRWFVYGRLRRGLSLTSATVVSSLGFMAHHVLIVGHYFGSTSATTCLFSAAVAIGGAYWAWLYQRSGSLIGPWLGHLLIDASIFVVGYDLLGLGG